MDKYQQQMNDQTMKMNQNFQGSGSPARLPNEMPSSDTNINQGMKNTQLSGSKPAMMGSRQGPSPNRGLEKNLSGMATPDRQRLSQGSNPQFVDNPIDQAQKMRANVGSADPQRNMARAQQLGGDARLSLQSDGYGNGIQQMDRKLQKDPFGNIQKPGINSQQMQNMDPGGPPTYRSMNEEDDLIQQSAVNMPSMNPASQKFNQNNFPGKDSKFNPVGPNNVNFNVGNRLDSPGIGGQFDPQSKETGQLFAVKSQSSNKKPTIPKMDNPASALLDDDYDQNMGIQMAGINSDEPRLKGKIQGQGSYNFGNSIHGSVQDEKQKLIQMDSPYMSNQQNKNKMGDYYEPEASVVSRASIIKNKLNPRSMVPQKDNRTKGDDQDDFVYEFIGRGQDTIVSSDIKKYIAPNKKDEYGGGKGLLPSTKEKKSSKLDVNHRNTDAIMNPINDALQFSEPRDRDSLDQTIFDYYAKNTFIRYVDGDEDPKTIDQRIQEKKNPPQENLNYTTIKDVRNIHISSDHQRAYVWVITSKKDVGSQVMMEQQRDLWLQVYSLSANWSSPSTLSQDQNQKLQILNSLRLEVEALQKQTDQNSKDKNKKEMQKLRELLKQKKQQLQQYEMEIYKEFDLFGLNQKPDIDQESQYFHLIDHYQSVNSEPTQTLAAKDHVKATKYFQKPQQSEFSIHIGTFEEPKIDYLSDPIQSFYKQFVSSEEGIYFFKYENKKDKIVQDSLVPSTKVNNFNTSQPQSAPFSAAISSTSGKTGVDSQSDGFSNPNLNQENMPILYKLSPYESKAERVIINGSIVRLPFDNQTNQFAIVRAMDPQLSRELSTIDNLMFAILKEVHLKQDELTEDNTSSQINRRMSSKQKRNQLAPKIIESRIEIYKANQSVATFGCNIDLKEVPARLDPKNLSMAHRQDLDEDDSYKPVKKDFNFCCWYLIDSINQSLNVSILLNEQMINMRTPYEYDQDMVSIEDFNKRLVVAKNQRLKIDDIDEVPFLQDYKISQNMPIYAIDLKEPTNFAKVPCFLKAANDAKKVWDRELLQNETENAKKFPPEKMLSPLQPQHQLQNLYEFQEQVFLNFDLPLERIYIILRQRPNDIDFEVLYPIIPDYLWASEDGLKIREEIDHIILNSYKKYLPEEPTQKSYKIEGVNKMLYSEQYNQAFQNKGDHEKVKQYAKELASIQYAQQRIGQTVQKKWTKETVRQCVSFHHIFLKKINDQNEGKETNVSLSQMSPQIFAEETLHQYGLSHFQCTWEAMKAIINQKSLKIAKLAQYSVMCDDYNENQQDQDQQDTTKGQKLPPKQKSNKKSLRGKKQGMNQTIDELAQEIKSPRSNKIDALQSPRALSKPRTILVSGGLVEPKDNAGLKVKFQMEKLCFCEGLRNFVHIIKFKKKHFVKRNNLGEVIKIFYKNNYYAFEEDFEFYDYEIVIGQLDVSLRQHSINLNEERDALKRTQQILAQYEHYDGIFTPLQNPYTPYQQLVMTYDIEPIKEEQRIINNQNGQLTQKEPIQIMQICQRQSTNVIPDQDNEDLCQMKNLPAEFSFQEFLHNDMFRKEYFEAQLLQTSQIRRIYWQRQDPESFPLIDYLNEQSLAKVWVESKSSDYNQLFNIRTIDIMDIIARDKNAKFTPRAHVILDSRKEATPQNYAILRNLLVDDMAVTTVKQSKSNPRNVVFAIRQKRDMSMPQEITQNGTITDKSMCLHLVGQLDDSFTNLKTLYIIRQQFQQAHAQKEYKKREKPLEQSTNVLEIQSFNSFAYQFAEQNSKLSFLNPLYGKVFDESYKNCRMMAFDSNFGESIDPNVEVFAVKMWKPLNSVKIFTYSFEGSQLQEIYEIPIDSKHLDQLQNIQIVRISDIKKTFALLLDWCSIKEIYMIDFQSEAVKVKRGHPPQNKYIGTLIGKYDFICPNMTESQYFSDDEKIFVPNLQMKLVPIYKRFETGIYQASQNFLEQSQELTRDGFSLIYDQHRVDFDYLYFQTQVGSRRVDLHLQNASNIFEYEYKITEKIKRNLNKECEVDSKYFQALIIKMRFRSQILESKVFSENDKFKLVSYFSKVLQGHRKLDYSRINEKIGRIGIRVDIFRNQDFDFFLQPRSELFGANLLTFLNDDLNLVQKVLQRWFDATKNKKDNVVDLFNQSLILPFLPSISGSQFQWQKHQYDFFNCKPRFCELDMNMMSPIGWCMFHKCYNTAKIYTDILKQFSKINSKSVVADHSVIFYSSIKQLLKLGSIDLSEFLDPDGVGEDIGCELFQQTLQNSFLPQFELSNENFSNIFRRNIFTLERNMQQALMIDNIQSPKRAFKEDEESIEVPPIFEVQYGLIDLQWVNILNLFDQNPIHRCYQKQKILSKKNKKSAEFDWEGEIKRHQSMISPVISHINFDTSKEIYKYQSIKLLINHYWSHQSYDFFKTQFMIYLIFFVLPFVVDVYYLMMVTIPQGDLMAVQILFSLVAITCQLIFFISEIIQMLSAGKTLWQYFTDFWNINDFLCLPLYLSALITTWKYEEELENSESQLVAIKVLYTIVIIQTFIKLLFFSRIFDSVTFTLLLFQQVICDLTGLLIFGFVANVIVAAFYVIYEARLMEQYFYIVLMNVLLLSIAISAIGQSYEQVLADAEAWLNHQKAEMIVECQQILLRLGYIQPHDVQSTVLIRKKKFADDISERLNQEKWSGFTQSLKMYLQFNIRGQFDEFREKSEASNDQVAAQLAQITKSLNDVQKMVASNRRVSPDMDMMNPDMDISKSKITYEPSLNNISH